MLESQFQLEATRDAIVRWLIRRFIILDESISGIADNSTGTTEETDTWKALLRSSLATLIGERKRTCQKTKLRRWFQQGQDHPQTRTMMPTQAHSGRIEVGLQNEIRPAIRRPSAREQQPLFEYRF